MLIDKLFKGILVINQLLIRQPLIMSQSTIERGLTCKSLRFFDNKDLELDK
jgi:hypothetical protein